MKKLLLCIATSVMAMGAVAQIQVTSDGSVKLSNFQQETVLSRDVEIKVGSTLKIQ